MAYTHSIPWPVWDHGDAPESFEPFERIDQPYAQWQLSGMLGAAVSPFVSGGFYTPEVIAQLFRDTAGRGTMTDVEFVQFATAHGIPEQSLRAAYGILTNASASVYPLDQRIAVLRTIMADPNVSYRDIVRSAAAYGVPESEVREAYDAIVREARPTVTPAVPTVPIERPTVTQPPIVTRSDNWTPPGWADRQLPAVLPPITTPGAVSTIVSMPRDIEASGGGLFPTLPPITAPGELEVGATPEPRTISPALIVAGIGAAALLFLRK